MKSRMAWDVTVASMLAELYVEAAARESGAAAQSRQHGEKWMRSLTTAFNQSQ